MLEFLEFLFMLLFIASLIAVAVLYIICSICEGVDEAEKGVRGDANWCHIVRAGPIYKFVFWLNSPRNSKG